MSVPTGFLQKVSTSYIVSSFSERAWRYAGYRRLPFRDRWLPAAHAPPLTATSAAYLISERLKERFMGRKAAET